MADKSVITSASKRVKGIVNKAKDLVGLGSPTAEEKAAGKLKAAISQTAEKAKGAVDEATVLVTEGADKARQTVRQVGQKVKDAGQKIKEKGD